MQNNTLNIEIKTLKYNFFLLILFICLVKFLLLEWKYEIVNYNILNK